MKNIGFDGSGRMSSKHKYKSSIRNNFFYCKINNNIIKNNLLIDEEFDYYMRKKVF